MRARDDIGVALESVILDLLRERDGTICPSEAARRVDSETWRALMPKVREAGRRLAEKGAIRVLQGGKPVDPVRARGPIRYGPAEGPPDQR